MATTFTWTSSAKMATITGPGGDRVCNTEGVNADHQAKDPVLFEVAQAVRAGSTSGTVTVSNA